MDIICYALQLCLISMATCITIPKTEHRHYPVPPSSASRDWFASAQEELRASLHLEHNHNVAKNVILFLGDGMGFTDIWASRVYAGQYKHGQSGEEHQLHFEKFPHVGITKTYNVDYQIPDSAGTATALLSGVKVNAWTVGVNEHVKRSNCSNQAENHVSSILQWSMDEGKATGIVTTTRITHATPSAAYAHSAERFWESDHDMNKPRLHIDPAYNYGFGCKDIARQLVEDNPNINVLFGGGRRNFRSEEHLDEEHQTSSRRRDGRDLIQYWLDEKSSRNVPHAYVWNKTALDKLDLQKTDYVLGLFEPSNLQYELERNKTTDPSLKELTEKAIKLLQKDKDGFFLLVEGGKIDHALHDGKARLALDETYEMDQAVHAAVKLTSREDTLIVVTADHSHSFTNAGYTSRGNDILGFADNVHLSRPLDSKPYTTLMYTSGPGAPINELRANLTHVDPTTREFQQQAVVPMNQETHAGEDVPVYALGPMAHLFHGVHEQHYVAHVMAYASCVGRNKKHCAHAQSQLVMDDERVNSADSCYVSLTLFNIILCSLALR